MILVSKSSAVSLEDLPNAVQEIMDEMAELKHQVQVLEQSNKVQ